MAATRSTMLELGTKAPSIQLPIVTGGDFDLYRYTEHSKGIVVLFICNHCPYVHHINETLVSVANTYINKGIPFIAISSNDATRYPKDSPEKMIDVVHKQRYPFPTFMMKVKRQLKLTGQHALLIFIFSISS